MIKPKHGAIAAIVIVVSGCTEPSGVQPLPDMSANQCDLRLTTAVGQPVSSVPIPNSPKYRVIRPGQAVTMDFRSDRTNIELNKNDIISRVFCG